MSNLLSNDPLDGPVFLQFDEVLFSYAGCTVFHPWGIIDLQTISSSSSSALIKLLFFSSRMHGLLSSRLARYFLRCHFFDVGLFPSISCAIYAVIWLLKHSPNGKMMTRIWQIIFFKMVSFKTKIEQNKTNTIWHKRRKPKHNW